MKQLFRKDIRANFRLALAGAAVFTLIIVLQFHSSGDLLHSITHGQTSGETDVLQPLLSQSFLAGMGFFCGIFGAALGFFQARNEAHRDLWAFLVHRPITRTQIFCGKTLAGLSLYFVGAGLPLIAMVCFAVMPGYVAAPFEPAMVLPAIAVYFTGMAYYFAGLLTGLRQARWFGSRTFAFGVGIAASVAINDLNSFWAAFGVTLLLIACVAIAAWGAYQSGGFYRGQPAAGKFALTLSLGCGAVLLLGLAAILIQTLTENRDGSHWQNYVMMRDGKLCIENSRDGAETYTDLDGKQLLNPDTGKPYTTKEFNSRRTPALNAMANVRKPFWTRPAYDDVTTFFRLWNLSGKTLWYLDRHGKLVGFNGVDRLHVGDIVARNASGDDPFLTHNPWGASSYFNTWNPPSILCTASTAYHVDLDDHKLVALYTNTPADPILGFDQNNYMSNFMVLTRDTVQLFEMTGKQLLSLPSLRDPEEKYNQASIFFLSPDATSHYALWFYPDALQNMRLDWKLPVHVEWVADDGQIAQKRELAVFHQNSDESLLENLMSALIVPGPSILIPDNGVKSNHSLSIASCAVFGIIGLLLVRRYRLAAGASVAWTLFMLAFGLPGVLTFFCAQEFPRREACSNCGKPRAVDREQCEHCAAGFPPPAKVGIEIFEPLKSS